MSGTSSQDLRAKIHASFLFMTLSLMINGATVFVSRFLLGHYLGPEIMGTFFLASAYIGISTIFVNTYGDRFVVVTTKEENDATNTVFSVELTLCFLLLLVWAALLCSPEFRHGLPASPGVSFLILIQCFAYPLARPRALLERELDFKLIAIINVVTTIVCNTVGLFMAMYLKSIVPAVIAFIYPHLLQSIVFCWLGRRSLRFSVKLEYIEPYARLCLPLVLAGVVVYFYWNYDRYLVDKLISRSALGLYGWAFSIGLLLMNLKKVVARVMFPVFSILIKEKNPEKLRKSILFFFSSVGVLYGALMPALVFLSRDLISLLGPEWLAAVLCFQISILVFSIKSLNSFAEPLLITFGRSEIQLIFSVMNCIIIAGGGYVCVKIIPKIETMAFVVLFSSSMTLCLSLLVIRRLSGTPIFLRMLRLVLSAVLSYIAMLALASVLSEGLLFRLLAVSVGEGIFLLLVYQELQTFVLYFLEGKGRTI